MFACSSDNEPNLWLAEITRVSINKRTYGRQELKYNIKFWKDSRFVIFLFRSLNQQFITSLIFCLKIVAKGRWLYGLRIVPNTLRHVMLYMYNLESWILSWRGEWRQGLAPSLLWLRCCSSTWTETNRVTWSQASACLNEVKTYS